MVSCVLASSLSACTDSVRGLLGCNCYCSRLRDNRLNQQ
uniref:Uncharacterized protein n=1 Tax=Arundo donax TaxID=35708 RepID=A0A0A9DR09_ARUDO